MSATSPKYVYGVMAATAAPPSEPGIDGAPLQVVQDDGLAALVSDIAGDGLRMGRDAMLTHARVLEQALQSATVLPMRFGVVMEDEAAVRTALLEPHRSQLHAQLESLDGKVELKLRVTYEEETLMREVIREDPDVRRLRDSLRGMPDDATYYGRIRLGELVAEAVDRKRQGDAEALLARLEPLALQTRVADPNHERVMVNASFLVERATIPRFDAEVDRIGADQAGRVRVKYTGPLPPHSFVALTSEA